LRGPQGGDPVEDDQSDGLLQARRSDHTAVADQHHAGEIEALLEKPLDLIRISRSLN
jgi:hypothetical protein